jgi:hypothetical protein
MIQNVLTSIGGVGMYGVISICIFVGVFVVVAIWMLCLKKSYLNSMQGLPLEDDTTTSVHSDSNINSKAER